MKKWKELCDSCGKFQEDCHGYYGEILCPNCARKKGFKKWTPNISEKPKESEVVNG